ncbi:MAG: hypothetical protein A2579_08430 [Lysobacterales bacterium RIFOXYD1_FULL_69_11]|nr:MAG: hypothetical protein A2579_08430 [Xanthomonadales bacterium RIFOXYD1_FULL_69_11]
MKLHHTLLAATLLAVSAPALAVGDDADIYSDWDMLNSIYVIGDVYAWGFIRVSGESAAVVDQDQFTYANGSFGDGDNSASASGDAGRRATGNIGINIAAGVGNAQANDGALTSIDGGGSRPDDDDDDDNGGGCGPGDRCGGGADSLVGQNDDAPASRGGVFASAMVFNSQTTESNFGTDLPSGPDSGLFYDASVSDNVLASASGNIGLNVAAGVGNAQTNGLAASVNSSGNLAKASADSEQTTYSNLLLAVWDLDNSASLSGNALGGAVGNIGVNIAAGAGNAQHNGLAIAVASCGTCD